MPSRKSRRLFSVEKLSIKLTEWMGTPQSLVLHTLLFAFTFTLIIFGIKPETVMLFLTTIVSLEAIYLSLFIQMTVNRQARSISEVKKDIDEIQKDVEDIENLEVVAANDLDETEESLDIIESHLKNLTLSIDTLKSEITNLKSQTTTPKNHQNQLGV